MDESEKVQPKPIVIDAKAWTGDDDQQALPYRRTTGYKQWEKYNNDMARAYFILTMSIIGIVIAVVGVLRLARYFGY